MALWMALVAAPLERAVQAEVNRYRAAHRLPALEWSEPAAEQARQHCRDIIAGRVPPGHSGFDARIAKLRKKLRIDQAAENVALLSPRPGAPAAVVALWIESDGHRRNLEGPYARAGIGVAQGGRSGMVCATQILMR